MSWNDSTFDEREQWLALYEARDLETLRRIARDQEMAPRTLARRLREHRLYKQRYAAELYTPTTYSPRVYTDELTLTLDNALLISDLEMPDVDPLLVRLAYLMGVKYGIKDLLLIGDLIATDQPSFNTFKAIWKQEGEASYRTALGQTTHLLKQFLRWFERAYAVRGNHDDKLNRATGGEIDIGMFLEDHQDLDGFRYSQYAHLWLETSRGPVYCCHPKQYSANAVALGQKLYNKTATRDGRKPHIVLGHTHQSQTGDSPDNLREIHSLGCLRDPLRTQYINVNVTTYPQWSQGFAMLLNGHIHNLSLKRTDWEFYLGELCPEELRR